MPSVLKHLGCLLFVTVTPALTQPLIVLSDQGGLLHERSLEIRRLSSEGRKVELHGECYSACTMYLGLPDVCVKSDATFGFHGPSWYGETLSPQDFDYWSAVLSRHYREPLRSWFMKNARHRLGDYYRISGRQLITMGYKSC